MSDSHTDPAVDHRLERSVDRTDVAAVFRSLAAALEDDGVRIENGGIAVDATIPARLTVGIEAGYDDDTDPPVAGLGIDLEWDDPDGSSLQVTEKDRDEEETAGISIGERHESDSSTDPAMATMPPDGVLRDQNSRTSGDDGSSRSGRTSRFEVYQDRADEWRWRLVHWNGNIVADSGEGYASRGNAERAVRGVMRAVPDATVVRLEDGDE
ncbi:amphi-Trp domain-containing protein [Natronobacterium texcoconense]|uniref:Amphi-Trp domain-containing protein n=1 Tax=Natronobacterium texcoconense TaxID=1095778 RepID=A0A1H0ZB93_NATTX|nr:DUF1508 domain-containing protein [Natronobacterium texcoconense]SDQ24725.1 amphi-Trp domain-containing protein [Natronobacterium texcoconense]